MILIILAFLANVYYSTVYLVDIPLQLTFATWCKYRWALLLKIDRRQFPVRMDKQCGSGETGFTAFFYVAGLPVRTHIDDAYRIKRRNLYLVGIASEVRKATLFAGIPSLRWQELWRTASSAD